MTETPMGFVARFWLAYVVFFKMLFDGSFARRISNLHPPKALPEAVVDADTQAELENQLGRDERKIDKLEAELSEAKASASEALAGKAEAQAAGALWLLRLLQREGRFVDFMQQDIAGFGDADVAGAARVIHEGCRKGLKEHLELEPIRTEAEGAKLSVEAGYDARALKLTGNVAGSAPYSGTLRHKGWRAARLELPELVGDHDPRVLAQAELEL